MGFLRRFLFEERGQDLIEYTILMAVIAIAAAAIFANVSMSVNSVWHDGTNVLGNAANAAS